MEKYGRIIISRSITIAMVPILLLFNVLRFGLCAELLSGIMASFVLLVIAQTDYYTHRIPDELSLLLGLTGLVYSLAAGRRAGDILLGLFSVSFPLFLLALLRPGAIGGGDVKLMAAAGILLGINGIILASMIGSMLAGIVVILGFATRRYNKFTRIAMAPYYVFGIWIVLFIL